MKAEARPRVIAQLEFVTGADGALTTFRYDRDGNQTLKSVRERPDRGF